MILILRAYAETMTYAVFYMKRKDTDESKET